MGIGIGIILNINIGPRRTRAAARCGKLQRLAGLAFIEELPRSAIGKVLKRELREQWTMTVP
ncbi:MAG: hypothetical protein EBV28_09750 [Betaproteobacteria bacterium]|nr:hypothetical protein [Betaproteobacteria bacterium]